MTKVWPSLAAAAFSIMAGVAAGCGPAPTSAETSVDPASAEGWRIDPAGDLNAFFDCLEASEASIVSAHRGGPAPGFPENAIETFLNTLSAAPALMEFDVATSADGVLYLMHDDTLDRTTTGAGDANALDWETIRALRLIDNDGAETPFAPPSFADAIAALKDRTIVQIDFKRTTRYEDVVAEVRRQGAEYDVVYIAYTLAQARRLHALAPESMISLSIDAEADLNTAVAAGVPADRLLAFTGLDAPAPRLNAVLDARDVEVIFGTLGGRNSIDQQIVHDDAPARYADIAASGVDIIATDRPTAAHQALAAAGNDLKSGECNAVR